MSAPTTLAEAWEAYAADNLPAGSSPLAIVLMRRCWFASATMTLKMTEGRMPVREQLLAEIVLFGRTVGREVELTR